MVLAERGNGLKEGAKGGEGRTENARLLRNCGGEKVKSEVGKGMGVK